MKNKARVSLELQDFDELRADALKLKKVKELVDRIEMISHTSLTTPMDLNNMKTTLKVGNPEIEVIEILHKLKVLL